MKNDDMADLRVGDATLDCQQRAAQEIDRLRAELDALRKQEPEQEPVAMVVHHNPPFGAVYKVEWYTKYRDLPDGTKLYTSPVPPATDTLEQATKYAHDIVTWLHRDHYADNTTFEPFDDILGLLSQIDNMICGWKEQPAATPAPVAQKVPEAVAKGWKCHCCGFDGPENQQYNRFCAQCRRSR